MPWSVKDKLIAWLQTVPVFGGLKDRTVSLLLDCARLSTVAKGDFFFREDERGSSMFVLQEGEVAVLKSWQNRDYIFSELFRGDCFGEMSLIDLGPRSASILALQPCSALEITAADLRKLYQQDVREFAMIHMNMGREVSRRLRDADRRLFLAKIEAQSKVEKNGPDPS